MRVKPVWIITALMLFSALSAWKRASEDSTAQKLMELRFFDEDPSVAASLSASIDFSKPASPRRKPASQTRGCLRDGFNVQTLQTEAKALETRYFGPKYSLGKPVEAAKLRAYTRGSNGSEMARKIELSRLTEWMSEHRRQNIVSDAVFSSLPKAQQVYLSWTGRELGILPAEGVDYSGCATLPCLVNRVYGEAENALPGWVHYWFFLRTGYVLNAAAVYPGMDSTQVKAAPKDFLFTPEELRGFWRAAQSAPRPMANLAGLSRVYRIPRGHRLPSADDSDACGRFYGGHWWDVGDHGEQIDIRSSPGYILLDSECLEIIASMNTQEWIGHLEGDFSHEVGHALEKSSIDGSARKVSLVFDPDWSKLNGWKFDSRLVDGRYVYQYSRDPQAEFVSDYAKTSPAEDWAESIAFYRYGAETLREKAPKKFEYLKSKVFDGVSYDRSGLKEAIESRVSKIVEARVTGLLERCQAAEGAPRSASASQSKAPSSGPRFFRDALPESVDACLSAALLSQTRDDLAREPGLGWEICGIEDEDWKPYFDFAVMQVKDRMKALAKEVPPTPESAAKLTEYRNALKSKIDSRNLWLSCWDAEDPKRCFADALETVFRKVSEGYKDALGPHIEAERETLVKALSFSEAARKAQQYLLSTYGDPQSIVEEFTQQKLEECLAAKRPFKAVMPKLAPFNARDVYVAPEILDCLNQTLESESDVLVSAWINDATPGKAVPDSARRYLKLSFMDRTLQLLYIAIGKSKVSRAQERERAFEADRPRLERLLEAQPGLAQADQKRRFLKAELRKAFYDAHPDWFAFEPFGQVVKRWLDQLVR